MELLGQTAFASFILMYTLTLADLGVNPAHVPLMVQILSFRHTKSGGVSQHEFPSKTPNWNFAIFPTWSSMKFKMEFKWESKLDFMDFLCIPLG